MAGWHFLSLPQKESKKIEEDFSDLARGFKSLPVNVTIGHTTWKTSIFLDRKRNSYLLPLKAAVRKKENIHATQTINYSIEILIENLLN